MLCAGTRRLERRSDVPHRGCRLVGDAKRVVSPPRRHVPDRDESFRSRAESFLFFSEAEAPGEAAPGPFAGCQGLRAAPKTAPEARGRTNDARRQVVTSSGASLRQSSGQCPLTELSVTGVWSRIVRHRGGRVTGPRPSVTSSACSSTTCVSPAGLSPGCEHHHRVPDRCGAPGVQVGVALVTPEDGHVASL